MSQRLSLLIAIFTLVTLGIRAGHAQTPSLTGKDEAAIRQLVEQLQKGWNALDGKAFAAPFAADADYVVVNGMRLKGKTAIEKGHAQIFATIYKQSRLSGAINSIRFLRPDVAVAHVEWKLEFRNGDKQETGQAINTMVLTKDNGAWSIATFQNTPLAANER